MWRPGTAWGSTVAAINWTPFLILTSMNLVCCSKLLPECAWCSGKRVQPRNLQSLVTVGSFDTYILLISSNPLKIYFLMFILHITLLLKKLIYRQTRCNFKIRITLLFWQYLCYEQSSYVIIGLELYRNALRHISFHHKREGYIITESETI
jgi:hypothetical protein